MSIRWAFFIFNWARFCEIKPALKAACESGNFDELEIADEVLEELDEETEPASAANAIILELCGEGEPVYFEAGLAELIRGLRRYPRGEDVSETLGSMISAQPNVDEWFQAGDGLAGILKPDETVTLAKAFAAFRRKYQPPDPPKGLAAITRRFAPSESPIDHLSDLMELVDRAVTAEQGLGVLCEQ